MDQGVFIVAGFHVGNGLVQLRAEVLACYPAVRGQDFQHIPVVLQVLPNGQGKPGDFAFNELAALLDKIEDAVIGREPQCHRKPDQHGNHQRHQKHHQDRAEADGARRDPGPGRVDLRRQFQAGNIQRPLQLVPLELIQLQVRGDQPGDFGDVDIQQFLGLYALLLAGQHHHAGGLLCGNIHKGAGQVVGGKTKEDDRHKCQKGHAPSPPYSMGLLSFMICVRAKRMMAAQIARAILPGVVKMSVWNQSSLRK